MRRKNRLTLICLTMLGFLSVSSAHAACDLVISRFANDTMSNEGQAIMGRVYGHLGLPVCFRDIPGQRASRMSAAGELDGELLRIAAYQHMHPTLIRVKTPLITFEQLAYSLEKNALPQDQMISLDGKVVGLEKGVVWPNAVLENFKPARIVGLPDISQMFSMLSLNRVDVVLADNIGGHSLLREFSDQWPKITQTGASLGQSTVYHYLHRKHADLVPQIEKALSELRESGAFDTIIGASLGVTPKK